ncbi:hypothetical protein NBRC116602_29860 [Hyphomicrobiales bacterium 4NK60-0047b]
MILIKRSFERVVIFAILFYLATNSTPLSANSPILQIDTGGHTAPVHSLIFTSSGEELISAGSDKVIRVWNISSGKTVRKIRGNIGFGNDGKIFSMALSKEDRLLAVGGWLDSDGNEFMPCCGTIRLFDFASGQMISRLLGHSSPILSLSFSENDYLASSSFDEVRIWDLNNPLTPKLIKSIPSENSSISSAKITPDGKKIIIAYKNNVVIKNISEDKAFALSYLKNVNAIDVSLDRKLVVLGNSDGSIELRQINSGKLFSNLSKKFNFAIGSLSFSGDSKYLLLTCGVRCSGSSKQIVFDLDENKIVHEYIEHLNTVTASSSSQDGKWFATVGGENHHIHIWNGPSGKNRIKLSGDGNPVWSLAISPNGKDIAWGYNDPCPISTFCPNKLGPVNWILGLPGPDKTLNRPQKINSSISNFIRSTNTAGLWSLKPVKKSSDLIAYSTLEVYQSKKLVKEIVKDEYTGSGHLVFTISHDKRYVFSGGLNGVLTRHNLTKKKTAPLYFEGHEGHVLSLALSKDGRFLISGSSDQTIRIWNARSTELLVSILHTKNNQWIIWTPQGYYWSSGFGSNLIGWHLNQGVDKEARFIKARQMNRYLNNPDIIIRALQIGSAREAVRKIKGKDNELQYLLNIPPPSFNLAVGEKITNKNYADLSIIPASNSPKIINYDIYVGPRKVTTSRRKGTVIVPNKKSQNYYRVNLKKDQNYIRVTAYNKEGFVTEKFITITSKANVKPKKQKLFLVSLGVNNYPFLPDICRGLNGDCDLKFAVKDAIEFNKTVLEKISKLYSETRILTFVNGASNFRNNEIIKHFEPTVENIKDEIAGFLDKVSENDTTIFMISGHGKNIDFEYHFLPTNAQIKSNGKWKRSSIINWQYFNNIINRVKGRKILFVDTCNSGNAYYKKFETDGAEAGVVIYSASLKKQEAQEIDEQGHSVFTYNILKGLNGDADSNKDDTIRMLELGSYVDDRVRIKTNEEQKTEFYSSGLPNFILTRW